MANDHLTKDKCMDDETPQRRNHLLIAGTGRAGTSFLVRYLDQLGLDTHLGRNGESAIWDEAANAGLEDAPVLGSSADLPYVIKSPWLYQIIDHLVANETITPDAVIIPVRDLAEAAASRSLTERHAAHRNAPWMSDLDQSWEEWAQVPGGTIYSLNPIDQGRLLAVGFHHLVQRLIAADIPIIFLAFPRLAEDGEYLFDKLRPVLPQTVGRQEACDAHRRVADLAKVRVGNELGTAKPAAPVASRIMQHGSHDQLDTLAIRREIGRLRRQLADAQSAVARSEEEKRSAQAAAEAAPLKASEEANRLREGLAAVEDTLAKVVATGEQAAREKAAAAQAHRDETRRFTQRIQDLTTEVSQLRQQALLDAERTRDLEGALATMRSSRSWRLTHLYRAVGRVLVRPSNL
jgi:hypothetical protein